MPCEGWEDCTIVPCEDPGIRTMSDLPSHWLAELWQDATCPESQRSPSTILQHQAPAPHSTAEQAPAEHRTAHWLFTAWVQLLVSKDTVALFQYRQTLGRFLRKLPLSFLPPSTHQLYQRDEKGSWEPLSSCSSLRCCLANQDIV